MWLLRRLKIGDFVLITFFAMASFFSWTLPHQRKDSGQFAKVYVKNQWVGSFSLKEDKIISLRGENGQFMLRIQTGKIRMEESHCPLKICEHQGWISKPGEIILCIPNRVYVRIEGNLTNNLDAITM